MAKGYRFQKGNNYGKGRPKGTGKTPIKRRIEEIMGGWHPLPEIIKELDSITEPVVRAEFLLQLMPYWMPKKREVEYSITKTKFGTTDLASLGQNELLELLPLALERLGMDDAKVILQ